MKIAKNRYIFLGAFATLMAGAMIPASRSTAHDGFWAKYVASVAFADDGESDSGGDHDSDHDSGHDSDHDSDHDSGDDHSGGMSDDGPNHDADDDNGGNGKTLMDLFTR